MFMHKKPKKKCVVLTCKMTEDTGVLSRPPKQMYRLLLFESPLVKTAVPPFTVIILHFHRVNNRQTVEQ